MNSEVMQLNLFDQDLWSGKTCLELSAPTKVKILELCLKKQPKSFSRTPLFLNLQKKNGAQAAVSWEEGGALLGEFSTHSFGESPSVAVVSRLSQILEEEPHPKYFLSAKACLGILRREIAAAVGECASVSGFNFRAGSKAGSIGLCTECAPTIKTDAQAAVFTSHDQDSRYTGPLAVSSTCSRHWGTGGNNTPLVAHALRAQGNKSLREDSETYPITGGKVRRLTPLECERLQGYPDGWTDIGAWRDSKDKLHKESSDSARYRALGNSIAIPPWRWVLLRLAAQYYYPVTMGSLFDGIGGFPLI